MIEEPVERLAAGFFNGDAEVRCFDSAVLVGVEVEIERPPEEFVPQFVAQHVQHPAPLGVAVAVEHLLGLAVAVIDNRPAITRIFAAIARRLVPAFPGGLVDALVVLGPEGGEVGGEAFVQPQLAPVFAGHQVAPPLVSQFVGHQANARHIFVGPRVVQGLEIERGRRGVLHAPPVVFIDADLRVLRPRVAEADLLAEVLHHGGSLFETPAGIGHPTPGDVRLDGDAIPFLLEHLEVARDHRQQVRDVGLVLLPVPGAIRPLPGRFALQRPVRKHHPFRRDGRDNLARQPVGGRVETGKPAPRRLGLALRPEHRLGPRFVRVGGHKMQPVGRIADRVLDHEVQHAARRHLPGEGNRKSIGGVLGGDFRRLVGETLARDGDPPDGHRLGVEFDHGRWLEQLQPMHRPPPHLALGGVELQFEPEVLLVDCATADRPRGGGEGSGPHLGQRQAGEGRRPQGQPPESDRQLTVVPTPTARTTHHCSTPGGGLNSERPDSRLRGPLMVACHPAGLPVPAPRPRHSGCHAAGSRGFRCQSGVVVVSCVSDQPERHVAPSGAATPRVMAEAVLTAAVTIRSSHVSGTTSAVGALTAPTITTHAHSTWWRRLSGPSFCDGRRGGLCGLAGEWSRDRGW